MIRRSRIKRRITTMISSIGRMFEEEEKAIREPHDDHTESIAMRMMKMTLYDNVIYVMS
jgi:hypothetical protein